MGWNRDTDVVPYTTGIQKFGVQNVTPRLIWVFRNGDKHDCGTPFYVKLHIRTLPHLLRELSATVKPIAGPVRTLYNQNLIRVTAVTELVDFGKYLCTSGEAPCTERLGNFMNRWIVVRP
eukprot:Polyplicarium_translucidae@DN2121_c0_g1_i2.p2